MKERKCFFADLTRVQNFFLDHLLQQKMAWRSRHGLDIVGIGNTPFSFEETLQH